jgi:twitching motility protein PilT
MVDVPQGGGRFRGSYFQQQYGMDAVFRVIPPVVPSLTDLNLPFRIGALTSFRYGIMFVTGPAGCGKTSTLSALVNHMNHNRQSHVLMLESPVEYRHKSKMCVINQREIGKHTESLPRALRAGLREAPDVIVVGDIYDKETMGWALTAAETGHFVLVTVYTANATETIDHVLSIFPPLERPRVISIMAESLRSIVSQRLVTTTDGKRRIPCLEVLLNTGAVSNLIRQRETLNIRSIMEMSESQGMTTLEQSLSAMVVANTITRDEAFRHCVHKEAMTV